ncbi:MAG: sialidase [Gemmataceae bacterium]
MRLVLCAWLGVGSLVLAADTDAADLARRLRPYFRPPAEFARDYGTYRSPLKFYDGSPVASAADWQRRRKEILQRWNGLLGAWPPVIEKPTIEVLKTEQREGLTQKQLRLEVAPGRKTDDAHLLLPQGKGPFPAVLVVFYESRTGIGLGKTPHRDFALQLARRGFVTLSLGSDPFSYYPSKEKVAPQPLSYHAYEAANCFHILASLPQVDARRIGIVGHSYGGKWAMFGSCLYPRFAAACWCDPGIVFDEKRPSVNYWEPWYLGYEPGKDRKRGVITPENPRTGPYKTMVEQELDLHELHALMAPRPFLVSGGSEDPPERWKALNHSIAVNTLLGYRGRVGMTNRKTHSPTPESNALLCDFFDLVLRHGKMPE